MGMELDTVAQLVTVLVAALAIVWHQQRGNDSLRDESNTANRQLREEFNTANRQLREEFNTALGQLRDIVTENGQRLARIEGRLGIGMPAKSDASEGAAAD